MAYDFNETFKQLQGVRDAMFKRLDESDARIERYAHRVDEVEAALKRPFGLGADSNMDGGNGKTLTALVTATPEFKAYVAANARGRVVIPVNWTPETKTVITSTAVGSSTPGILTPARVPGIVKPGIETLRVRSLIPAYPCSNNAVEFVKENQMTNAASPVEEGATKPESALTFTIAYENVRTIAHWIPASRQVLDDFDGLRSYLDVRLIDGLLDIEDNELLHGSGTGQHLNGLCTQATAYAGTYDASGDTYLDKLNHALCEVEDAKFRPTGIVLNPADARKIQLQKTEDGGTNKGSYVMGGPVSAGFGRLWNTQISLTSGMPKGNFLVGDFSKCGRFERMPLLVELSTEHESYFTKNLVALRAEMRETLIVTRTDAFIYGQF